MSRPGLIHVTFSAGKALRSLGAIALVLVAISVGARGLEHRYGCEGLACTAVKALDVDGEANLPTWYSASVLLVAALLSAAAARAARAGGERHAGRWGALALVFTAMSLDEIATVHEHVSALLRASAHLDGWLHNAWVLPAAAFVLLFGAWMIPFLRALPSTTRRRFVAAGAIYLSGAVGMEVIDGAFGQRFGEESFGYAVLTGFEELGELLGMAVMIYGLLDHLGARRVSLEFERTPVVVGPGAVRPERDPSAAPS